MNLFYRSICFCFRQYFHIFYHSSVYGVNSPLKGKAILAPNHASFFDPPLIGAAWPEEVHFLARASLFHYKFWGLILSYLNAHPIHGTAQDVASFRLICQLLKEGKKIVIFPEGERSVTGELQTIKSGIAMLAIKTQSPIIPIYINGTYEAWPRNRRWPKLGTSITCVFGKPISPITDCEIGKKKLQEKLTLQIQTSMTKLRLWLENGAQGEIP